MNDLAIIVVSTNEARWLTPCLSSIFEHAGPVDLDVVVVDNGSTDGTAALVEQGFPRARVVSSENRGFSHANNRGLATCDARWVLFLNPDTEVRDGTFAQLVQALDARPTLGLAGVKQVTPDGELFPTIRRFPSPIRAVGEIFGERVVSVSRTLGERELDLSSYEDETPCDWTSGSFMVARREALEAAGFLDERFFIFAEETDLCLRIKRCGWEVRHLPVMTILHHADKVGLSPKMTAQGAYARVQYARKNFPLVQRWTFVGATFARYLLRYLLAGVRPGTAEQRREACARAMRTMLGLEPPPFGPPPAQAVASHT